MLFQCFKNLDSHEIHESFSLCMNSRYPTKTATAPSRLFQGARRNKILYSKLLPTGLNRDFRASEACVYLFKLFPLFSLNSGFTRFSARILYKYCIAGFQYFSRYELIFRYLFKAIEIFYSKRWLLLARNI